MPKPTHRPPALQWRVFLGAEARERGLLTPAQLRGDAWVRLRHDVYADARLDRDHGLACRGAALVLPPAAVFAGPSAACLHGVAHAAEHHHDVHVIVPPPARISSRQGVIVHATSLRADEAGAVGDLTVTTPERTAWDVAAWCDLLDAVPIVDDLLGRGLIDRGALDRGLRRRAGVRGCRRAARVFGLADAGARSPGESRLRVRLVLAGLPRPVTRHPIAVAAGVTVRPDLSWPPFRVAVEYDGRWQADADRLHLDRRRLNQLVGAGWIVLHVTPRRVHRDFGALAHEVRSALIVRGWRPGRS